MRRCAGCQRPLPNPTPHTWKRSENVNPVFDFEGQVALITGASSGIGLATGKAFAEAGAAIILVAI